MRVTLTFRMRKATRSHARHVMIPPRCMLRVRHHGLAPTRPGASVTVRAKVQLPPVCVRYVSILILSVSILLFAGILLSTCFCSFLFLSRVTFLVDFYQRRADQKTYDASQDHYARSSGKCTTVLGRTGQYSASHFRLR